MPFPAGGQTQIVRGILGCTDFLHDYILLAPQFLRIESRVREDIGQNIEGERHVGLEHARKIACRLCTCCSVEIPAHCLDSFRNLSRRASLGALESHMFEQMRNTVLVVFLVAATRADPHAERSGFKMRHSVSHNRQTGGKTSNFNAHAAAPSRAARETDVTYCSTAP